MTLIKQFFCIQKEIFGNGSEEIISQGICEIKKEFLRPEIIYKDFNLKHFIYLNESNFNKDELLELSLFFNLPISSSERNPNRIFISHNLADSKYDKISRCLYYKNKFEDTLLIITSSRWQFDNQPRSAAEDQLGEDITYIHGIWENPDIAETIIKKIKGEL